MKKAIATIVCSAAVLLAFSVTPVQAGDSLHLVQLSQRSAAQALKGVSAPVLARKAGPGKEEALNTLANSLGASTRCLVGWSPFKTEADGPGLLLRGDGWTLSVADSGQHIRYGTESAERLPYVLEAARPSDSAIESWGRGFVLNELKSIVRLGPNEELVFLGTRFENIGMIDAKGSGPTFVRQVVAVFGRRIGDLNVIAAGSKVAVIMTVDSRITGFDVDWPEYQTTQSVEIGADIGTVEDRAQQMSLGDLQKRAPGEVVKRLGCGYHDGGGCRPRCDTHLGGMLSW